MNDLTEQWKKGELFEGFYYVKCDWSDEVEIRYVHNGVDDWKDIIEQVPSYDEWKEKTKSLKVLAEAYCKEKQQNKQLKELLKECKGIFDECFSPSVKYGELYKQIDEVLR